MLPCVVISYVASGSAGKEISKEEGNNRLAPSPIGFAAEAAYVSWVLAADSCVRRSCGL